MGYIVDISNEEYECLVDLALMISAVATESEEFCKEVKALSKSIPPRIAEILRTFAEAGSPTGCLLFRVGPSFGFVPRTPPNNSQCIGERTLLAKIQALLMSAVSELVAYEAECNGNLFQDIVPMQSMAAKQTSMGSVELEIHTEQAFSEMRPDFLSLACLRGDPAALTYILSIDTILASLTEEEHALLRQPLWLTGVDLSFKLGGREFCKGDVRGPMPILTADSRLVFDQDLMRGIMEEAHALIAKIVAIYYRSRQSICLEPGNIVIIDNRHAVHGRSTFNPKYNGYDRFLVRCFGVSVLSEKGRLVEAIDS